MKIGLHCYYYDEHSCTYWIALASLPDSSEPGKTFSASSTSARLAPSTLAQKVQPSSSSRVEPYSRGTTNNLSRKLWR